MPSRFWKASGNALLPSCNTLTVSAAAWTPASLAGLKLWVEAGDLTNLYTDAGTTHVAADGDAVYLWKDKSGNARDIQQSTAGARPLYKTDLSKPSLKFDGIAQLMTTASGLAWGDGSNQLWMAVAFRPDTTTTAELITFKNGGTYICDLYANTKAHMEINGTSGFEEDTTAAATVAALTSYVGVGTVTSTQSEAFIDNISDGAHTNAGTLTASTGLMGVSLGGTLYAGRIFGILAGSGTLTSTDRSNIQTYMAALHP